MAVELGISLDTVKSHFKELFRKVHVRSRTQLLVVVFSELLRLTCYPKACLPPLCARFSAGQCPLRVDHNPVPGYPPPDPANNT